MIETLIQEIASDFGLRDIHGLKWIYNVKQTAFTWTESPESLCLAVNTKYYAEAFKNKNIRAIIAPLKAISEINPDQCVIVADNAAELFYCLHNMALHTMVGLPVKNTMHEISETATIADTSIIAKNVGIGDNVEIGHGCIIQENTIILDGTVIGPKCVIGVDGFFSKNIRGQKTHIRHFGGVHIGRNCKLHSGLVISRSVNHGEFTEIGDDVHIGHKTAIAHDCKIGKGTNISVNALLSGRTIVGKNCWVGASASISNACKIGDNAYIRIGSVVISDVEEKGQVSGNFAYNHIKQLKRYLLER